MRRSRLPIKVQSDILDGWLVIAFIIGNGILLNRDQRRNVGYLQAFETAVAVGSTLVVLQFPLDFFGFDGWSQIGKRWRRLSRRSEVFLSLRSADFRIAVWVLPALLWIGVVRNAGRQCGRLISWGHQSGCPEKGCDTGLEKPCPLMTMDRDQGRLSRSPASRQWRCTPLSG